MSPEQAEGRPVSGRSDVFSFGVVLYELLTGRRPFGGTSEVGVITAILRDQPPPLRAARAEVPADLEAIVERCLQKDPSARYADGGELRSALATLQQRRARPADPAWRRPRVLIPAALLLVAAAGAGVWQTLETRRVRWAQEALPEIERLQQADFPVGGISWYEADAYARFAGATLPTVYHWNRAANVDNELSSDILQLSNVESTGPPPIAIAWCTRRRTCFAPWTTSRRDPTSM